MKDKPPPENQQAPYASQYNKNGKNTPFLDSSDSPIAAALLWQQLI